MKLLSNERKILLKHIANPRLFSIEEYEKTGGYQALKKAKGLQPDQIIEEVKKSGLRGRGGAGFPTGNKWGFVPFNSGKPIYLLCNADESEPGTFKDRIILERNPHLLIEGIIISAYAVRCKKSYIYIRGEYAKAAQRVQKAVDEAKSKGYLGDLEIVVHRGAGAYICGEETGLISSLEGKKGQPKLKPPFPAVSGFLQCPTVVNNVETLATIPWIIGKGGDEYAKYGVGPSKGTRLFCLSGWVNRPGVYEEEMGLPLMDLINHYGQGLKDGAKIKAVIPGGSSTPPLTADEVAKATLDYDCMGRFGTFLGSGGIIVIPDHYPVMKLLERLAEFYWDESCGQCTPCREGTGWLFKLVEKIYHKHGVKKDFDDLKRTAGNMMGTTICALADAAAMPILGFAKKFPQEFEACLQQSETEHLGKSPSGSAHG